MVEVALVELQLERQTQKNRLAALEMERNRTSSTFRQETLDSEIRTQTQHLCNVETVLAALLSCRTASEIAALGSLV